MGKVFELIDDRLAAWIGAQHMFFVATAPRAEDGFINCSPKGGDSFRVLGPREVAYQDLTGSGVETIAHLRDNGRIVVMFCAFEGSPKIVRLHGQGRVVTATDPDFHKLAAHFTPHLGTRSFIHIDVHRVSDSCGYAVPRYDYVEDRDVLDKWCDRKGPDGLERYRARKNARSIDGLPGLDP